MSSRRRKKERPPPRFTPQMLIADALALHPGVKDVLLSFGLPCHRCVVQDSESLQEGCTPLGLKTDEVLAALNALDTASSETES